MTVEEGWVLDKNLENKIREELMQYEIACMEKLEECIPTISHTFSRKYQRRMKHLFWSQRHFGKDVRMGLAVRRVIVAAMAALILFIGNAASGKYLGFSAWDTVTRLIEDGTGKTVTYHRREEDSLEELAEPKRAEPGYIPKGFAETDREGNASQKYLDIIWYRDGMESIRYIRTVLEDGREEEYIADVKDSRWLDIKGISVNREVTEDGVVGLTWCDAEFNYQLEYDEGTVPDEEINQMIESIYE